MFVIIAGFVFQIRFFFPLIKIDNRLCEFIFSVPGTNSVPMSTDLKHFQQQLFVTKGCEYTEKIYIFPGQIPFHPKVRSVPCEVYEMTTRRLSSDYMLHFSVCFSFHFQHWSTFMNPTLKLQVFATTWECFILITRVPLTETWTEIASTQIGKRKKVPVDAANTQTPDEAASKTRLCVRFEKKKKPDNSGHRVFFLLLFWLNYRKPDWVNKFHREIYMYVCIYTVIPLLLYRSCCVPRPTAK